MIAGSWGPGRRRLATQAYRALKRTVLERDGWKCQSCGRREQLEVHHQVRRSQLGPDEVRNLITLCSVCHRKLHRGRR